MIKSLVFFLDDLIQVKEERVEQLVGSSRGCSLVRARNFINNISCWAQPLLQISNEKDSVKLEINLLINYGCIATLNINLQCKRFSESIFVNVKD